MGAGICGSFIIPTWFFGYTRTDLGWWLHSQLLCHMFKLFMVFRRDNTQPPSNIVMHQRDLTETHETNPPRYMWRLNAVLWNCTLLHTTHPFSIFKESSSQPTPLDDVGFTNDTSYQCCPSKVIGWTHHDLVHEVVMHRPNLMFWSMV